MENTKNYWIFIDNSNLFIEGQRFYASRANWRVKKDSRFRIDFGKLIGCMVKDAKNIKKINLYGSEPPPLDTVWHEIEKNNIIVNKFLRNAQNKEKEVDQALAVDATESACEAWYKKMSGTFIFLTGDRDISPAIKKVIDRRFKVLVVSYENALSRNIRDDDAIEIKYLDEIIMNCCYLSLEYKSKPPINNSITISFNKSLNDADLIKKAISEVADMFRLPCLYKWNEYQDKERKISKFILVLIFSPFSNPESGEYDFDELYRGNLNKLTKRFTVLFGSNAFSEIADSVSFRNKLPENFYEIILTDDDELVENTKKDFEGNSCFRNNSNITTQNDSHHVKEEESEWTLKRAYRKKRTQKYSEYCPYGFTCEKGEKCEYKHSNNEKIVFNCHGGKGCRNYKSRECPDIKNCKFKKEPLKCSFAHDLNEARCYKCLPKRGSLEHHWMRDCEKLKTTKR